MKTDLTNDEKRRLLKDGFIVVRNAVSIDLINRARQLIEAALPKTERQLLVPGKLATHEDVTGLLNKSTLANIMRNLMGPYPPVISCQVAVIPPHDKLGGKPGLHVDGGWSGVIPDSAEEIDPDTNRPRNAARYFGEHDQKRGTNDGLLWMDPDRTLSYGSYTALVGVALNDQLEPGGGQFGVLKGVHEKVEACFKRQRDAGGIVGPEGPDWPRIRIGKGGTPYTNGLPDAIRDIAEELSRTSTPVDNWPWPELTPIMLGAGDAVIALHSCPHTATPNLGPNPRMNIYFRIRRLREGNPNEGTRRVAHGVSDHPDRGYFGQYLDYPDDHDPWKTSIDKLCNHWSEWDGMRALIKKRQLTDSVAIEQKNIKERDT